MIFSSSCFVKEHIFLVVLCFSIVYQTKVFFYSDPNSYQMMGEKNDRSFVQLLKVLCHTLSFQELDQTPK